MKFLKFLKRHMVTAVILVAILIATTVGVIKVLASTGTLASSMSSFAFQSMSDPCSATITLSNFTPDSGVSISAWTAEDYDANVVNISLAKTTDYEYHLSATPISPGSTSATIKCNLSNGEAFTTSISFSVPLVVMSEVNTVGIKTAAYTGYDGDTCQITVNSSNATWTSTYPEVVKIIDVVPNVGANTSTVYVQCKSGGKSTITASVGGYTCSTDITVGVKIDTTVMDVIDDGGTKILQVEQNKSKPIYTNSSSSGAVYYWSADDSIATVDENGIVTGVYAGTTTIYASCLEGQITQTAGGVVYNAGDSIRVDVPYSVVDPTLDTLLVGDQITFSSSAKPSELQMTSSDLSVITYDSETGLFTAVGVGDATISIARRGSAEPAHTFSVHVIDDISLSTTNASIGIGDTLDVIATVTNAEQPISWSISDPSIAQFALSDDKKTATVTGLATGTTTLVATQTVNGIIKTVKCTIYVMNPVTSLGIYYNGTELTETLSIQKGNSVYVTAILNIDGVTPDNTKLTWVSSNDNIITVLPSDNSQGDRQQLALVKAINGGNATITVVSDDGLLIATASFYVTEGVTGISLDHDSVTEQMALGKYQLTATIIPQTEGVDQTVIWASLDPSVVTVDSNGLVTFVGPGETYVSATSAADTSKVAYCKFIITQQVEDVKMDFESVTMNVGEEYRLSALITPENATNKKVFWSSSNEDVVTVDSTGLLTAKKSGSATIIVQTEDGGYIDMTNVKVLQPVISITLSNTEMVVKKGTVFFLGATCNPETADDKTVKWASSDTSLATVDQSGKVTAVGVGSVTISCTSNESGAVAYCLVEITEPVTGLELNSYYEKLVKDSKFVIIPTVLPNDAPDKSVTYLSSDPEIATVDENGIVTALKGGTAHILVTTNESHLTQSCTIVVEEFVESVEITGAKELLNVGDDLDLDVIVLSETASNKEVVWTSSNKKLATVDKNGRVHGVKAGKVVITAVAADGSGASDSVVIRVINPVKEIKLSDKKITIYVGDTRNVVATVVPDEASIKELRWESDNPTIAMAYQDGDIVGVNPGRTVVRVHSTDGNNVQATLTVIVKPIVLASNILLNSKEITMLKGKTRALTAKIYPYNTNEGINWMSTDTSVVQVDQKGNIVTVGAGTAEVIAYSSRGTVQSTCIVHSIAMHTTSLSLEQYDTYNLYVDGAVKNISWRSSNPRVATVSQDGIVIGRMPGECTITATTDNKTVTCFVKVYAVDPDKFIHTLNDK